MSATKFETELLSGRNGDQSPCRPGVEAVFGYPAERLPHLRRALPAELHPPYSRASQQAAVHAAEGYARSTGKVGVFW